MTDDTLALTDEGAEDLAKEIEAFQKSDETFEGPNPEAARTDEPAAEPESTEDGEAKTQTDEKAAAEKPPLSRDELEKRWRDQQAARAEERGKRREAEESARAAEKRIADLEARIQSLSQAEPQQDVHPFDEAPIDPQVDPIGAIAQSQRIAAAMRQERAHEAEKQQEAETQTETQRQETAQRNAVQQIFNQAESDFRQVVPDYDDAIAHLKESRARELKHQMPNASEHQITALINREAYTYAVNAIQNGTHPASVMYDISMARGYQPKAAPNPTVDATEPGVDPEITKRQTANRLAKTMSGAGGGATTTEPTIASANAITDGDKFDEMCRKLDEQYG